MGYIAAAEMAHGPTPVKLVESFDPTTVAPGGHAHLTLRGGTKVATSTVLECISHPIEGTCWVRTRNTVYSTDPGDYDRYVRSLWAWFGDIAACDDAGKLENDVNLPGLGSYPAGTDREDVWHDFEDILSVPVHTLMFPGGEM